MPASDLTKIHLHLPRDLLERFDRSVWDPIRDKPTYAARSRLIRKLIERHLDELAAAVEKEPKI